MKANAFRSNKSATIDKTEIRRTKDGDEIVLAWVGGIGVLSSTHEAIQ